MNQQFIADFAPLAVESSTACVDGFEELGAPSQERIMFELNNYVTKDIQKRHSMIFKRETAPLRGIWKGKLTGKEIDEGIKEIRSEWRIETQ